MIGVIVSIGHVESHYNVIRLYGWVIMDWTHRILDIGEVFRIMLNKCMCTGSRVWSIGVGGGSVDACDCCLYISSEQRLETGAESTLKCCEVSEN